MVLMSVSIRLAGVVGIGLPFRKFLVGELLPLAAIESDISLEMARAQFEQDQGSWRSPGA